MPRLITSMPCAFFSAILRSSWANRYGGMRSKRLLDLIQLLHELVGQVAGGDPARPAGGGHVQGLADLPPPVAPVEGHGHRGLPPPPDGGDRGAGGARG